VGVGDGNALKLAGGREKRRALGLGDGVGNGLSMPAVGGYEVGHRESSAGMFFAVRERRNGPGRGPESGGGRRLVYGQPGRITTARRAASSPLFPRYGALLRVAVQRLGVLVRASGGCARRARGLCRGLPWRCGALRGATQPAVGLVIVASASDVGTGAGHTRG